jgi:hypothetical protein
MGRDESAATAAILFAGAATSSLRTLRLVASSKNVLTAMLADYAAAINNTTTRFARATACSSLRRLALRMCRCECAPLSVLPRCFPRLESLCVRQRGVPLDTARVTELCARLPELSRLTLDAAPASALLLRAFAAVVDRRLTLRLRGPARAAVAAAAAAAPAAAPAAVARGRRSQRKERDWAAARLAAERLHSMRWF